MILINEGIVNKIKDSERRPLEHTIQIFSVSTIKLTSEQNNTKIDVF